MRRDAVLRGPCGGHPFAHFVANCGESTQHGFALLACVFKSVLGFAPSSRFASESLRGGGVECGIERGAQACAPRLGFGAGEGFEFSECGPHGRVGCALLAAGAKVRSQLQRKRIEQQSAVVRRGLSRGRGLVFPLSDRAGISDGFQLSEQLPAAIQADLIGIARDCWQGCRRFRSLWVAKRGGEFVEAQRIRGGRRTASGASL